MEEGLNNKGEGGVDARRDGSVPRRSGWPGWGRGDGPGGRELVLVLLRLPPPCGFGRSRLSKKKTKGGN